MKHQIRTTMRPDQVVEVTDQEYEDLDRQGLVAAVEQPAPPDPAKPAARGRTTQAAQPPKSADKPGDTAAQHSKE
ncbi:hypothetical protein [Actinomadura nitritigenes]|uniref:hypothetical protein n=1 Tax=Actinomadura nitritigenes TaxID=134602 RepID=UPI003D8C5771